MVLQYTVCDVELPNPGNFPYPGKFPHPGYLQEFLQNLIPGLTYTRISPYLVKAST